MKSMRYENRSFFITRYNHLDASFKGAIAPGLSLPNEVTGASLFLFRRVKQMGHFKGTSTLGIHSCWHFQHRILGIIMRCSKIGYIGVIGQPTYKKLIKFVILPKLLEHKRF
jgi:hypothetical protein